MMKRLWLVARIELFDQLTAPWLYAIMAGMVLVVLAIGAAAEARPEVLASETGAAEPARGASPRARERALEAIDEAGLRRANGAARALARSRGAPAPELPVVGHGLFAGSSARDALVVTRGIAALFFVVAFFSMTTELLARAGTRRILRTYTSAEFFAGRFASGLALGACLGAAMVAAMVLRGTAVPGRAALAASVALAAASAVAFGLFCALAPRAVTRRAPHDLLGGLTLMGMGLLYLTLFAGVILPLAGMPPGLHAVVEWLPPAPAVEIATLAALGGLGSEAPPLRDAALRYAASIAALGALDVWLLGRR